jgi:threonine dehydratase
MAQGLAWWARRLGVHCTVVLPDTAPETKIAAIRRLGADMIPVTFEEWHEVFRTRTFEGLDGLHVHAFSDEAVMAGNGTITLEILEDLPEVDAIVAPYGGGGLSCGIASAIRALAPSCKVFAAEVATAAPLAPSLEAGRPVKVDYTPSFVDGIGSPEVFPEMFELARELLDGALVAELAEVEDAVRLLAERARVVAEGAGATSVALARNGAAGSGKVVCVVSGGNIDASKLAEILSG